MNSGRVAFVLKKRLFFQKLIDKGGENGKNSIFAEKKLQGTQ